MKYTVALALALAHFALPVRAADAPPPLKHADERAAWEQVAQRFTVAPALKNDSNKTFEVGVAGLKSDAKGGGTASIRVDKATGHVVEVTSNGAKFTDEEFALFAKFPELAALTLWHNGSNHGDPAFTGAGLARVAHLPKLTRVTLAGGGLADPGMVELAKLKTLRELRVWHAPFTDAGVAALRGHPSLEAIKFGPSWAQTITDKSLESLSECPKLKTLGVAETWLTWEKGLSHLVKRKATLAEVDLGNCIIDPADVDRLRRELPDAKVVWKGLAGAGADFQKAWLRTRAEKWIPKELIARAIAEAGKADAPAK